MKKEPIFWVLVALNIIYVLLVVSLVKLLAVGMYAMGAGVALLPLIFQAIVIVPIFFSKKKIWLIIFIIFFLFSVLSSGVGESYYNPLLTIKLIIATSIIITAILISIIWVFLLRKNLKISKILESQN